MARVKQTPAENFNKPLAVRLRALIDESGHSKADLGKEIGVSRQAINDYTLGNSVPDANNLLKLAKYFGVTSDYLLGLEPTRAHEQAGFAASLGITDATMQRLQQAIGYLHEGNMDINDALNALLASSKLPAFLVDLSKIAEMKNERQRMEKSQSAEEYYKHIIMANNLTAATYKNEKAVFLQPQAYVDYRMYLAKKSFDEIADDILNRLIEKEV